MKKNLKKFLAGSLVGAMTVANFAMPVFATDADEPSGEGYYAFVAFGGDVADSSDWNTQYYGKESTDNVGDYTVTDAYVANGETATIALEFAEPVTTTYFVAPCLIVDDVTVGEASTFDVKVAIDGEDITDQIDFSVREGGAMFWYEGTGAYSGDTCVRIAGGYNEWGDKFIAEAPKGFTKIEFTITPNIVEAEEGEGEDDGEGSGNSAGSVDLDGTYNAYLYFQTPAYSFRNPINDTDGYGLLDGFNAKNDELNTSYDIVHGWDPGNVYKDMPGTFTDAVIEGNGTYTVSVSGLEWGEEEFASAEVYNQIGVSTDIPNSGEISIDLESVVVKIGGRECGSEGPVLNDESADYVQLLVESKYNKDVVPLGYYDPYGSSIEITFTVSGFNYDKAGAEEPTDEETEAPSKAEEPEETEAPSADNTSAEADNSTAAPTSADNTNNDDGGISPVVIVVIVVVVVAVIAAGVVVAKKKKSAE